jgi:hypothetical protein
VAVSRFARTLLGRPNLLWFLLKRWHCFPRTPTLSVGCLLPASFSGGYDSRHRFSLPLLPNSSSPFPLFHPLVPISFLFINLIIFLDLYSTYMVISCLIVRRQPVCNALHPPSHALPAPTFVSPFHLFLSPIVSTTSALFHFPYPATPLFATLTKTAGCVPTIPKKELT